ncbi:MAG: cytochrome c biogenesis protein CcdA [Candidatus Pacearchaeota archaeon]|nr:cytochrome c biogenesis protein CcdA [Candidatus Pacearchaeota archaeon]
MNIGFLIIPSFLAGILTFLAPCSLPLVPGYLSFISGTSGRKGAGARARIFLNAVFYVIGFSVVFMFLGSLFGLGGAALIQYRFLITRIGGALVVFFGLFLLFPAFSHLTRGRIDASRVPLFSFLMRERVLRIAGKLRPGTPGSSLAFGAIFAAGWTPCVGPILATVLTLAASSATLGQGAFLMFVFSLGLAIPFLGTALAIGWVSEHIARAGKYLAWVSVVGGAFLVVLGIMMMTNNFGLWVSLFYRAFDFINYQALLQYL